MLKADEFHLRADEVLGRGKQIKIFQLGATYNTIKHALGKKQFIHGRFPGRKTNSQPT
jgi:hypothetical protein